MRNESMSVALDALGLVADLICFVCISLQYLYHRHLRLDFPSRFSLLIWAVISETAVQPVRNFAFELRYTGLPCPTHPVS